MRATLFLLLMTASAAFADINVPVNTDSSAHIRIADSSGKSFVTIRATLLDSLAVTNFDSDEQHVDNMTKARLDFKGAFTEAFHWKASAEVNSDYMNREILDNDFEPYNGISYTKEDTHRRSWNNFTTSFDYDLSFVKLLGGIDYLSFGPAKHNKIILRGSSDYYRPWKDSSSLIQSPAPTPYFGYEFTLGPITYTQFAAKIFHEKNYGKYMHAHRLSIDFPFDIEFGISEETVYGSTVESTPNPNPDVSSSERNFEWAYVIPFVPYVFEEPYLGDKDNNALAFDLSIKTLRNWEFYTELLWDDMRDPLSMFDDSWWGNKWAATLGTQTEQILGPVEITWLAEYTRIEPWVYTHHKGAGYTYTNYGQCLGSDLGPNAQELYTKLDITWKICTLSLTAGNTAKDTAFGGNLYDIHTPLSDTTQNFLVDSTTFRYTELGGALEVRPFSWLRLRAGYTRYFGDYNGFRSVGFAEVSW